MRALIHVVQPEDDGRQIKRVIRSRMQISYGQFSKLKAQGGFLLDGEAVHANHVVRAGQQIRLSLTDERGTSAAPEPGPLHIAYQDDDLMVIDKPAPLPCQSSPRQPGGTLENRLAQTYIDQPGWTFRPVNRLDKGTSGLMVVAKHAHAQMLLSRQLHTGDFVREYLAIVCGRPSPESGMIDAPIAKADGATVRREVSGHGKPALTHYQTLGTADGLTLIRLRLSSGRTHQIRVHLKSIGCPVFGDFLYGQEDARLPGRFALHACHLEFAQPLTGVRLIFDSPLPPELQALCPTSFVPC